MAVYRNISLSFWTDSKVEDNFSPEDKYMYLYLLTNPHTNICGCYEISIKQICNQTGYNTVSVQRILDRLINAHRVVVYCEETQEMLIINWGRYNWTTSDKLIKPITTAISCIKCKPFQAYVGKLFENIDNIRTVSIPYPYGMDTTVSVTVTDTVSDTGVVGGKIKKDRSKLPDIAYRFDALWELYPRKQGKMEAFAAYKRAVRDGVTDEQIKAGIEAYTTYIKARNTEEKFIKTGGPFFNQRAWDDDYSNKGFNKPTAAEPTVQGWVRQNA